MTIQELLIGVYNGRGFTQRQILDIPEAYALLYDENEPAILIDLSYLETVGDKDYPYKLKQKMWNKEFKVSKAGKYFYFEHDGVQFKSHISHFKPNKP